MHPCFNNKGIVSGAYDGKIKVWEGAHNNGH